MAVLGRGVALGGQRVGVAEEAASPGVTRAGVLPPVTWAQRVVKRGGREGVALALALALEAAVAAAAAAVLTLALRPPPPPPPPLQPMALQGQGHQGVVVAVVVVPITCLSLGKGATSLCPVTTAQRRISGCVACATGTAARVRMPWCPVACVAWWCTRPAMALWALCPCPHPWTTGSVSPAPTLPPCPLRGPLPPPPLPLLALALALALVGVMQHLPHPAPPFTPPPFPASCAPMRGGY